MNKAIRVVVTGAAGNLGYNAVFRLAAGEAFGEQQPLILHLCDLPGMEKILEGIAMEIEDGCFLLVEKVLWGSDLERLFTEVDYALLIGSKPRGPGMERAQLLESNSRIFSAQGEMLNRVAHRHVTVLVVGNPCNTNALVTMTHAPDLKRENFHALLRLDQNRATALLAKKAHVNVSQVKGVTIWGNHSLTQVPDFTHVTINNLPIHSVIREEEWLRGAFMTSVQKRGAAVIEALGRSSAASAAKGVVDALRALYFPTPEGEWFSTAVCSDSNPYGIEKNLIFGFPCRSAGRGKYTIVPHLTPDAEMQTKIALTIHELRQERAVIG